MLSRMIWRRSRRTSGGMSLRKTLPPSGSGRPVSRFHHSPRSTIFREPAPRIRQLAFMDDQPGVRAPAFHRVEDLVERHDDVLELAEIKLQREKRARHLPGRPQSGSSREISAAGLSFGATTIGP